ncbi:HesA/MoeB/ThiF family protein [Legionella pneumophila]|uniref:HesA/MoeB/ThiF family protein n=1 Tax=Legionella pneumophila TaxID=446 RepID=UPI001A1EC3C1|nr:HesA/MoeB/ThiF family protein [Legionella pneumophila]MCH9091626.1 thiamine biosynthesis protein ThiF [Legionella pneumophila serogroup 1]MCH9115700.1 thiamine biosynthesis protein ThiF [Legionella pneumophila serogroup 1]MCH9133488.1 thiamine biosynthesis protein ThiF [Legionella pneumophila serogroup 1]MDW8968908.1 HesA/MoeB/ThiF family protein [Legionella pneumophila]MDW9137342.1 HesA/MoeB/ThiF family protein [Legionella pneumophila]
MERYKRQIAVIGEQSQKILSNARIMIVGLGGIGCPVAQYLAAAGVGKLILVDNDKIDLSNLHRQILFNEADVGDYKAEKAKVALSQVNCNIVLEAYTNKFDVDFGYSSVSDVDLIIDGTDNFETRYLINDICVLQEKVFISCSIFVNVIQLVLFDTKHCCYRCLYPNPPPTGAIPNCSEAGVLGTVTGIAGTMAANLALNYLLKVEDGEAPQVRIVDAKNFSISSLTIKQNNECIACKQKKINFDYLQTSSADYGISIEDLDRNKHFLVDIRQKEEREIIKLDDDLFFPIKDNNNYAFFLSYKDKKLVFYCASGYRSKLFASELRTLGVDAYYLKTSLSK